MITSKVKGVNAEMKSVLRLLVFIGCVASAHAQDANDGGIPNAEIVILKDRQIVLPKADRNFEKIPPRQAEAVKHELTYQLKNLSFNSPDYNPTIRPLKLKDQEIPKIYGNYLAAGLGNYSSPYLEGFLTSKRERNKMYGAHFYHHSFGSGVVDAGNSGSGGTLVDVSGKLLGQRASVGGQLIYQLTNGNFYGYVPKKNVKKDTIEQHYAQIGFNTEIESTKKSDIDFIIKVGYRSLSDNFRAKEGELHAMSNFGYTLAVKEKLALGFDFFLLTREDAKINSYSRQLVKLKPAYEFSPLNNLSLTLGANLVHQNDPLLSVNSFHFFPNINANYKLGESALAYGLLTGDIDKVSLRTLSNENFWISANQSIANVNRAFEFSSGLKGKMAYRMAYHLGFSFANLKGYYFYQSSLSNRAKFDATYEVGNTKRTNLFLELGFSQEAVKLNLRGDYFGYSRESGLAAFHLPTYKVSVQSSYNIYSKILLNVDLIALGGMTALDNEKKQTVDLPSAFDLSIKANYLVSKNVSFFINANNLLSSNYQLYLNYPVRGLQAMGGVSCTF